MSDEGQCKCGCGGRTRLAPKHDRQRGWVKGEPLTYIQGHNTRVPDEAQSILDRIRNRTEVDPESGCWKWTGCRVHGYGQVKIRGTRYRVHRLAYELLVGPIPDGLVIDHVATRGCSHKSCWNPDHLEPVTQRENVRRAGSANCRRESEVDSV